jgi:PleD family two-component response regulator
MSRDRDEQQRLAELRAYKIVDTPPEPAFDQIAHFAAKLFDTPMSMIIPRGTERILVVEDEPAVRAAVVQQLTSLGYTVAEAANGSAGLELLGSRQTYDLLLTDSCPDIPETRFLRWAP